MAHNFSGDDLAPHVNMQTLYTSEYFKTDGGGLPSEALADIAVELVTLAVEPRALLAVDLVAHVDAGRLAVPGVERR
jgi:hypothetical protein